MDVSRYIADSAEGVLATPLGDLVALYHRRSGITHIVAEPVPQILEVLARAPHSIASLLTALAQGHHLVMTSDSSAVLQHRIDELCASGLVIAV